MRVLWRDRRWQAAIGAVLAFAVAVPAIVLASRPVNLSGSGAAPATQSSRPSASSSPSTASRPTLPPASTTTPSQPRVDASALTAVLAAPFAAWDQNALLALTSDAAARSAAAQWWQNVSALGADAGYAYVVLANAGTNLVPDTQGGFSAAVRIGFSTPFDPVTPAPVAGDPARAPTGVLYTLGLRIADPAKLTDLRGLRITSWQPMENAPWDAGALYVSGAGSVRAAGMPDERSLIDSAADAAQTTFDYDRALLGSLDPDSAAGLPSGLIVFASGRGDRYNAWFRTTPASGTPTRALTIPMVAVSPSVGANPNTNMSGVTSRTARVLVSGQSGAALRTVLSHEIVHVLTQTFGKGSDVVPRATVEGYAEWVSTAYATHPNLATGQPSDAQFVRALSVRSGPFDGSVPSTEQIYGGQTTWFYGLSASIFQFLSADGDDPQLPVRAARLAYETSTGAFEAAARLRTEAGRPTSADALQAEWASWVRRTVL